MNMVAVGWRIQGGCHHTVYIKGNRLRISSEVPII